MKKAIIALGLSGALMFSSVSAFAADSSLEMGQKGAHHQAEIMPAPMQGLMQKLDLSNEQKTKIEQLFVDSRSSATELRDQLMSNAMQIQAAMQEGSVNLDLIKKLADTQGELSASLLVNQAKLKNQIFDVLTKEQKAQLLVLQGETRERMKDRFNAAPSKSQ